ncbi:MAG: (Fe-S)-binding protein, partial [Actinomycetota bacterium]
GDFRHATVRCVGMGRCRIPEPGAVMCPSFSVTREEEHTTRGRAHLLFEMLQGDVITGGWRSPEVKDALDLCLACKGCTNDCPVSVDMPTYKAEFLHHHFKGRLRPRHAYAMGLIDLWAAGGSRAAGAANLIGKAPLLNRFLNQAAGVAKQRPMPALARVTLRQWFAGRPVVNAGGPRVLMWSDTFSNFFDAAVGIAGVEALEAAGYQVVLPRKRLCCGRPLYDYGFLGLARRYLRRCVDGLRDEIRSGTPVVGLEPSCLAVFKDELPGLMPGDEDAARLAASSLHFSEFLATRDHPRPLPQLQGKALVWGHCHHRATGGLGAEEQVLRAVGLDVTMAPPGCCGLAGSWGFEAGHYDLSMQIAERGLLPAVRGADPETLIVADGFSCRTQLGQSGLGRKAVHLAQVLAAARQHS